AEGLPDGRARESLDQFHPGRPLLVQRGEDTAVLGDRGYAIALSGDSEDTHGFPRWRAAVRSRYAGIRPINRGLATLHWMPARGPLPARRMPARIGILPPGRRRAPARGNANGRGRSARGCQAVSSLPPERPW